MVDNNIVNTNGDVMFDIFPNIAIITVDNDYIYLKIDNHYLTCSYDWWYSPYEFKNKGSYHGF